MWLVYTKCCVNRGTTCTGASTRLGVCKRPALAAEHVQMLYSLSSTAYRSYLDGVTGIWSWNLIGADRHMNGRLRHELVLPFVDQYSPLRTSLFGFPRIMPTTCSVYPLTLTD